MPAELSLFATLLLHMIIASAVPVLAAAAYKFISTKADALRQIMSADQYQQFLGMVHMVVNAAEQAGIGGLIENDGANKRDFAVNALQAIVDARGLNIPIAQLEAEVEDAVRRGVHLASEIKQQPDIKKVLGFAAPEDATDESADALNISRFGTYR
jgi:hypothetical protein